MFYRLSAPKKVVVMLGGPTMNLILAAFFFLLLLVGIGIPTPTTTVAEVGTCVPSYMATRRPPPRPWPTRTIVRDAPECGPEDEPSPAVVAGIVAGDRITSINGQPVSVWTELTDVTRASPGRPSVLGLETASGPARGRGPDGHGLPSRRR